MEVARAVVDLDDVPVLSAELCARVVGEARVNVAVDGDAVVVVDENEVVKPKVTGERDGLLADALLQAAVAGEAKDLGVAGDGETFAVILSRDLLASDRETDGVGDALAERACSDLDTRELNFWVTSSNRAVSECRGRVVSLELVEGPGRVAREMEEDVLEEASVAGREDEACG